MLYSILPRYKMFVDEKLSIQVMLQLNHALAH